MKLVSCQVEEREDSAALLRVRESLGALGRLTRFVPFHLQRHLNLFWLPPPYNGRCYKATTRHNSTAAESDKAIASGYFELVDNAAT